MFFSCYIFEETYVKMVTFGLLAAQVSSIFWLLHSDLHDIKASAAFEYMSSMVANVKPLTTENTDKFYLLEQNYKRGEFHASLKRRNGRVRIMVGPTFSLITHTHI